MKNKLFLILGSAGQLGSEFQRTLTKQGFNNIAPKEDECNITDFLQVTQLIKKIKPDIIINCAAFNAVDDAELKSNIAFVVNAYAVRDIAEFCRENRIFFIHYSSDYIFDGEKEDFYVENDPPNPLNIYGKSKLLGETHVSEILSEYLIFRLSWVIGKGKQNFLYKLSNWAEQHKVLKISSDEVSVPTFTMDIVSLTLLSLKKGIRGLYHLTNSGYASRYELSKYFIEKTKLDNLIIPVPLSKLSTKTRRPLFSPMSNKLISKELNISIPHWKESLDKYLSESKNF